MQHGVQVLLPDWDDWTDAVIAAWPEYAGPWHSEQEVTFLPPVTHRPTVYCAGANYRDHLAEMGRAQSQLEPYHFLVPPAALAGHRGTATRPPGMQRLDWEAELVAVIGRRADTVTPEQALDYVAGYTVANDLSCRDERAMSSGIFGIHWLLAKGWRDSSPSSPRSSPPGSSPILAHCGSGCPSMTRSGRTPTPDR
jgi:2-keto-4-pentenoate hydratase/2-oxohepta-3-ene-1,7-dioic acid hydratase in catechol pathway